MDKLDQISKALREGKRDSERRVQERHRDGNQIIYGGYRRMDTVVHKPANCPKVAEAHAPMNAVCSKCGRVYCDHENKY